MVTYIPRHEQSGIDFTTSTNFTGSNGLTNRAYTLQNSSSISAGLQIIVAGQILQNVADFTFASGTITFLGRIWDDQTITIDYYTYNAGTTPSGTDTIYVTTTDLAKFMGIYDESINITGNTFIELVGTGDNSTKNFFLDYKGVLANSYTLYYGATAEASLSNQLTETTHYSINKDKGLITLTATGVTVISANKIYADYAYNTIGLFESQMQDALNRAAAYVDSITSRHFVDGSAATPDWIVVVGELHRGKGKYDKDYYVDKFPVGNVSTILNGDHNIGLTTLTVESTNGFPESGTLSVGSEELVYTGKTGTTFTCSATTQAHSDDDKVLSWVVEFSNTVQGTTPTYQVIEIDSQYNINTNSGRVHLFDEDIELSVLTTSYPPPYPARFRISYLHGEDSIPDDIKQATLMLASKDIMHMAVRKATANGMNNFNPSLIDVDQAMIDSILQGHKSRKVSNI